MRKELENYFKSNTMVLRNAEKARKFYSKTLMNAIVSCSTLSVLKLAVDRVNFGLFNYLDYFACSLLIAKKYILTLRKKAVYQ